MRAPGKKIYTTPRLTKFEDREALLQAFAVKGDPLKFAQVKRFLRSAENLEPTRANNRRMGR